MSDGKKEHKGEILHFEIAGTIMTNVQTATNGKHAAHGEAAKKIKEASTMPSKENNTGMQQWFASNGLSLFLAVVAFASAFAYMQATVGNQREKIDELKAEVKQVKDAQTAQDKALIEWMTSTQNILREVSGKLDGMNSKK